MFTKFLRNRPSSVGGDKKVTSASFSGVLAGQKEPASGWSPINTVDTLPVLSQEVRKASPHGQPRGLEPVTEGRPVSAGRFWKLQKGTAKGVGSSSSNSPGVKEVTAALDCFSWHITSATGGGLASELLPTVLPDAGGILVVGDTASMTRMLQLVVTARSRFHGLPIMVLVLDAPNSPAAVEATLEVQCRMEDAGADDVIFRPEGGDDALRLAVYMGARRAKRRLRERQLLKESQRKKQVAKPPPEENAPQREPQYNKMFWCCVHRILEGFPKIEPHRTVRPLGVGDRFESWTLCKTLGEGAFGTVYESSCEDTGHRRAVKVVRKETLQEIPDARGLWREFMFLQKLQHPYIVRCFGVTHSAFDICIHMELVGQEAMSDIINAAGLLPDGMVCTLGEQVASALGYCHGKGIAHRDVKHDNIVICRPREKGGETVAKLVDFGLAVEVKDAHKERLGGTMPFACPEVLQALGKTGGVSYDFDPRAGDVWSLGVVLLEGICGLGTFVRLLSWPTLVEESPQRGNELATFFSREREDVSDSLTALADPFLGSHISDDLMEFFLGALQVDHEARWTAEEAEDWLRSCPVDNQKSGEAASAGPRVQHQ